MPTLSGLEKRRSSTTIRRYRSGCLTGSIVLTKTASTPRITVVKNMIIHGDNLDALKALLPRYEGRVKCIYIDPPYNTGNEGWVYNDNVNDPKIKKWLGDLVGKEGDDLTRHDKWLCMMYPRLKLLHKLLSVEGAIFISIDDNEIVYLRAIMDEIFWLIKLYCTNNIALQPKGQKSRQVFCYLPPAMSIFWCIQNRLSLLDGLASKR